VHIPAVTGAPALATQVQDSYGRRAFCDDLSNLASDLQRINAGDPMEHKSRESLDIEKPVARYANYFQVGHNAFEVVVEFGQHYEGNSPPQMHTRIVTAPICAKTLLDLLQTALAEYERSFGDLHDRNV
jgi:hypothetical protein